MGNTKQETVLDFLSRDNSDLSKVQESIKRMHQRDFDDALTASELIQNYLKDSETDETVISGLICLQKDYQSAVNDQNVAYLALLLEAFRNVSDISIQEVSY